MKKKSLKLAILTLIIFSPYLKANETDIIAEVDVTRSGRQKLFEAILKEAIPTIENTIKNVTIEKKVMGVDKSKCTPELIAKLYAEKGMAEVYKQCQGIPDYLFADGSWIPSFYPRPLEITIDKTQIRAVKFGDPQVTCVGTECSITIPLRHFEISSHLNISQAFASSRHPAGTTLIDFSPFVIKIKSGFSGREPSLRIKANINTASGSEGLLSFDTDQTKLDIPLGAVEIRLPDNRENLTIGEIINERKTLSIYPKTLGPVISAVSMLLPNLAEFTSLFNLNQELSKHFTDEAKVSSINSFINNNLLKEQLKDINKAISSASILKGIEIKGPIMGMQDVIDFPKIIKSIKLLQSRLEKISTNLKSSGKVDLGPFDDKIAGIMVETLIKAMDKTRDKDVVEEMDALIKNYQQVLLSLEKNYSKDPLTSLLKKEVNQLQSLSGERKEKLEKLNAENPATMLKLVVKEVANQDNLLRILLVNSNNDCESELTPSQNIQSEISAMLSINIINKQILELFNKKLFNFCIVEDDLKTCGNNQGEVLTKVEISRPPQISYNQESKDYIFEMAISLDDETPAEMIIHLQPKTCDQGFLCLKSSFHIDQQFSKRKDLYTRIIDHSVNYITSAIPLLQDLNKDKDAEKSSMNTKTPDDNLEDSEKSIKLPYLKILKIDTNSQYIRLNADFE